MYNYNKPIWARKHPVLYIFIQLEDISTFWHICVWTLILTVLNKLAVWVSGYLILYQKIQEPLTSTLVCLY